MTITIRNALERTLVPFPLPRTMPGEDLIDPEMCFLIESDLMSRIRREPHPEHEYQDTFLMTGPALAFRVNYEWWWRKWGSLPVSVLVRSSWPCMRRKGWVQDPAGGTVAAVMGLSGPPLMTATSLWLDLDAEVSEGIAHAMLQDLATALRNSIELTPVDKEATLKEIRGLVDALWEAEMDDPLELLFELTNTIVREKLNIPRAGRAPSQHERDAYEIVGQELRAIPVRHLYEQLGGSYTIEPDRTMREDPEEDHVESGPVALFDYQPSVIDELMETPEIRAIYAPPLMMNRASEFEVERDFKRLVNMTASQIRRWHKDPRSKDASLPHIRAELPLLARTKETAPSQWTPAMRDKARRAVAFIKRHEAQLKRQDHYTHKRVIALLNWGRIPPGVKVMAQNE